MSKNICYGNITVGIKGKNKKLVGVVFKEGSEVYKGNKIISIESFKVVGKENTNKGFHNAKKNEEKRNSITGAYE